MDEASFKRRTKRLGLDAIRLACALPRHRFSDLLARQLVRSATSVGANYRAACRSKSRADMVSKMSIVEEEADETLYWLELLVESEIVEGDQANLVMQQANEILAMTHSSIRTLRNLKSKI